MKIDKMKSVAEISGNDWGEAPSTSIFQLRERHELRRKALKELDFPSLELLLKIDFESDSNILVPYSLNRLGNSFSTMDLGGLSLLQCVLDNRSYEWRNSIEDISKTRSACKNWLNALDDKLSSAESTSDKLEFYRKSFEILSLQNCLLERIVEWERAIK